MTDHQFLAVLIVFAICFLLVIVIIVMLDAKTHGRIDELERRLAAHEENAKQ